MRLRGQRVAWILAVAYLLIIAYASLEPLRGWREPPADIRHFLSAPWPRYVTLEDLWFNVLAYLPLGFLLGVGLRAWLRAPLAVLVAATIGVLFSLAMEGVQMFLPTRIASNVDVLTNGTGAFIGALAAPVFSPSQRLGAELVVWRDRWLVAGSIADMGFIIAGLWLLTQLHPTAQLFGTGNLRETLDLPAWFLHTPQASMFAEAAVVFLNFTGLLLVIRSFTGRGAAAPLLGLAFAVIALGMKALSAAYFKAGGAFAWLTPGVSMGLLGGLAILYPLTWLPRRLAALCGLFAVGAALVIINVAPDNPYQTIPPQLLVRGASHILSFSGMMRALSEIWPLLALCYLLLAAARAGRR